MRYLPLYVAIIASFCLSHTLIGGEVITFFVRAYPIGNAAAGPLAFKCDLQQPGKIAEYCLQAGMRTTIVSGIFFAYAGFLSITNVSGQVIFPRKQTDPSFELLITDKLTPMPVLNTIIDHWELETGTPFEMYLVTRAWDTQARLFYWTVKRIPGPADKKIPLTTIVMFAKPKHVFVPTGVSPASSDPNLVLPDIYVRETIRAPANSMYLLNLRQFFGPIGSLREKHGTKEESLHIYDWGHEIR